MSVFGCVFDNMFDDKFEYMENILQSDGFQFDENWQVLRYAMGGIGLFNLKN